MTAAKKNPFDDESDDKVEPKTDNKVVETPEDKAGTAQDKPADASDKVQNADGTKAEPKKAPAKKTTAAKKTTTKKKVDFGALNLESPLSAVDGQITGTVTTNDTAVPILKLSLVGWIGNDPLTVPAETGFDEIRKVLDELEKEAGKL